MGILKNNIWVYWIFPTVLLIACNSGGEIKNVAHTDSLRKISLNKEDSSSQKKNAITSFSKETNNLYVIIDTTNNLIKTHFDFNDFSNEGGEGYAFYDSKSKKIRRAIITLYGEREQTVIEYIFLQEKIKGIETTYRYLTSIGLIQSDSDMIKDTTITYIIDYKGGISGNPPSDSPDIYQKFQEIIPFIL